MSQVLENKPSYQDLEAENFRLRAEIVTLKRLIFGQKRERFIPADTEQMELAGFESAKEAPADTEEITYTRPKRKGKQAKAPSRQPLPAALPRKEIIIEPDEDTAGMKKIGEEVTEELEYEPAKFWVNRYIRPKYARPGDQGIAIGFLPSRPIEKGIPGPGLLSHMLISKYIDHLPLYRQQQQFLRIGVEIPESTLCGWVKRSARLLSPLYERLKDQVLSSDYLQADETPIRVLDPMKSGTTHQGYYWVYYDPIDRAGFFDYQKGRSRAGPNRILQDFKGCLQTDGYNGYDEITRQKTVTGVGCMSHARRYFVEARSADAGRADWMLSEIQKLYATERRSRDENLSFDQRLKLRQEEALPVLEAMKAWLDRESIQVLPKSAPGKAIAYMLSQWSRLTVYVTDGRLEIDNNLVENAIRPVAVGRKNYLFAGSHGGARQAALIYTLMANARLHKIEPFSYLRDVLSRISDYPYKKVDDLLPANWKNISLK
jgi:transposase